MFVVLVGLLQMLMLYHIFIMRRYYDNMFSKAI